MDFIFSGWYLRRKTPSFQAINLSLVITSSFFRFNLNEIDIPYPRQKCIRLVFLLFQNDEYKILSPYTGYHYTNYFGIKPKKSTSSSLDF